MRLSPWAKQYWFWAFVFFGLYTLLALFESLGAYVSELGMEKPPPWGPLLRQEFKSWYSCGLLSLVVIWFCGRHRLQTGETKRWVAIHFVAALVFSAVYTLFTSWLVAGEESVMYPGKILTFSYLLKKAALHYLVLNLIMYWFIVFAHSGWHFYRRFRERELQSIQLQRELVEARLDALRMQLNPHFLFNALHAISALIHEKPEAADRMIARLSDLLRLSLDQSKPQEVPLREELDFLDHYLDIEQARFEDRLKVDKQIEPATLEALVPCLVLQPLVENAIHHGIEPREDTGHLTIAARRRGDVLELRVSDNGAGLQEDCGVPAREGIGLSNTRSRLRHLYGDKFNAELVSRNGGGLEAQLDIPFHTRATEA